MNWLVYHIASGQAFFSGVALVVIAALASTQSKPIAKRVTVLGFLIGAIAITISSTAIPYWYYGIALVVTIAWVISRYVEKWRRWAPFAVIGVWTIAAAIEVPYHITPTLTPAPSRSLTVIGDSVTAGMGGDDRSVRWPTLLADLDALLAYVSSPGRQVVMFELPLPPLNHEYGRIQRSLARKHNVSLVPKRVFLSVLAANDSTLDTIHLSQAGHRRMAACVWQLVSSAFPSKGTAQQEDSR